MSELALAALALAGLVTVSFAGLLRWQARQHARESSAWIVERSRLVDQVCHLAGRPWTPAPTQVVVDEEEEDERDLAIGELLPEHIEVG